MGVLISSAVPRLRCPEEANIRSPESVVTLHTSFIRAGADLIETNTFGANRRKLAQQYLEDEFERINSAGVKLAREAREVSGREVFIAGSIGPLGELAAIPPDQRGEIFAEQALLLDGRGVDLFMIETFYELDELETAIEAVRSVSSLPIVATLTFDEGAETLAGVSAAEAAERLRPLNLAAIGANHGAGLHAALAALEAMGGDGGPPLAALPNVGLASLSGGRVIYPHATPEYFAEFAAHARQLGARLIGGCCGTTPARDRRDPLGGRGGARAERAAGRDGARAAGAEARRRRRGDGARAQAARGRVGHLRRARPAEGRHLRLDARGRADAQGLRQGRLRRHQRQPDGPRAGERAHGLGGDRARLRHRDDPARHSARHVDHGPGVAAARRPRGRRPQHPLGHRRPAGDRRLPRLARRLRGGLDRALAGRLEAQPRRGLQRQGHRRADLVLPRRRGEPVGRRPRDRGRALPPRRSRPARSSR